MKYRLDDTWSFVVVVVTVAIILVLMFYGKDRE